MLLNRMQQIRLKKRKKYLEWLKNILKKDRKPNRTPEQNQGAPENFGAPFHCALFFISGQTLNSELLLGGFLILLRIPISMNFRCLKLIS